MMKRLVGILLCSPLLFNNIAFAKQKITSETSRKISFAKLLVDVNVNQPDDVKDPLEKFNRKIFTFNTFFDDHLIRPLSRQYVKIIPSDIRDSYGNFRSNLAEPWNAVNHTLQGNPKSSVKSIGRFLLNSVTSLGFVDLARRKKLENEPTDFGITLGVWGVPSGTYLMLPLLGPSTLRDGTGRIADNFARPQRYILKDHDKTFWSLVALDGIDSRAKLLDFETAFQQGDRYSLIRDSYLQARKYAVAMARHEDISQDIFEYPSDNDETDSSTP